MFYYQRTLVIVNIVFPALAVLAVLARLLARRFTKLPLAIDDWLIIVALVVAVARGVFSVIAVYMLHYGDLLTIPRGQPHYKWLYAEGILNYFLLGIIKCSIVLFYKRIFVTRTFIRVANTVLLLCIGWTIAVVLTKIFQTIPIYKFWTNGGFTNVNQRSLYVALNVTDLVLDLVILGLPLPMVRKLKISPKKRLGIMAIFGLGIFCIVATCARLHYYLQVPSTGFLAYITKFPRIATTANDTYTMWFDIECSASVITACLPTLAPFFMKIKSITASAGNGWARFKHSETTSTSHSDDSLGPLDLSKSHEKGSPRASEAGTPNGQIQATTVGSVV